VRRRAPHRAGIRPSSRRLAHDHRPAPFKGRERNDAVHAVAPTPSSVPSSCRTPSVADQQETCTVYLHSMSVYFVCMDGRSISFKRVESIARRPVVLTQAACAAHLCGAYRLQSASLRT
jgi:hypothetical protein